MRHIPHKTRSEGEKSPLKLCAEKSTYKNTLVRPEMVNNIALEDVWDLQIGALGIRAIIVACQKLDVSKRVVTKKVLEVKVTDLHRIQHFPRK